MRIRIFLFLFLLSFGSAAWAACGSYFAKLLRKQQPLQLEHWTKASPHNDQQLLAEVSEGNTSRFVFGEVQKEELFPGYIVVKIKDRNGNLHYLDEATTSFYEASDRVAPAQLAEAKARSARRPIFNLDRERMRSFVCTRAKLIQSDPMAKKASDLIDRQIGTLGLPKRTLLKYVLPVCLGSVALPLAGGYYTMDHRRNKQNDWISDHESNFTESIMILGFVHTCVGLADGGFSREVLTMALGATVAGNIYSEVALGQDQAAGIFAQPVSGYPDGSSGPKKPKKVKTDLPDLALPGSSESVPIMSSCAQSRIATDSS